MAVFQTVTTTAHRKYGITILLYRERASCMGVFYWGEVWVDRV